jgi:hypothetical protein
MNPKRHIFTDAERGHRPKTLAGDEKRFTVLIDPATHALLKGNTKRVKKLLAEWAAEKKGECNG